MIVINNYVFLFELLCDVWTTAYGFFFTCVLLFCCLVHINNTQEKRKKIWHIIGCFFCGVVVCLILRWFGRQNNFDEIHNHNLTLTESLIWFDSWSDLIRPLIHWQTLELDQTIIILLLVSLYFFCGNCKYITLGLVYSVDCQLQFRLTLAFCPFFPFTIVLRRSHCDTKCDRKSSSTRRNRRAWTGW